MFFHTSFVDFPFGSTQSSGSALPFTHSSVLTSLPLQLKTINQLSAEPLPRALSAHLHTHPLHKPPPHNAPFAFIRSSINASSLTTPRRRLVLRVHVNEGGMRIFLAANGVQECSYSCSLTPHLNGQIWFVLCLRLFRPELREGRGRR